MTFRYKLQFAVLVAGLGVAGSAWALDDDADKSVGRTYPAQVEAWRSLIKQEAAGSGVPLDFLLTWVRHESYGNPCALGIPGHEAGIAQTWHPHDDRYGATYDELRAACEPDTQKQARALTAAEKNLQVASLVAYVKNAREVARGQVARAGLTWSESSRDFWNLVKLRHALPALGSDYLGPCRDDLGRPPGSWAEFREWMESLPDERVVAINKNVAPWSSLAQRRRLLDNAEKTGGSVGDTAAGDE
jgi:hypothetical protein